MGSQSETIGDPQQTPKNIQYSLKSDHSLACLLQLNLYEPHLIIPFFTDTKPFLFLGKAYLPAGTIEAPSVTIGAPKRARKQPDIPYI